MAKLLRDDTEIEIKDGESIIDAAKKLGVSFGCQSGLCGACNIIVLDGHDNLTPKSVTEEQMGLPRDNRLACQCKIKHGLVKIRY
jgi:ferredoxin